MSNPYYRVEVDNPEQGCKTCGHGQFFTVVFGQGEDEEAIANSFESREDAEEICRFMNEAREAAQSWQLVAAAEHARDVLSTLYAKYGAKIGPYSSQAQQANVELGAAIAAARGQS